MTKPQTPNPTTQSSKWLRIGHVIGVHGLKGFLKVQSFTEDPLTLFSLSPLYNSQKKELLTFDATHISAKGHASGYPLFLAKPEKCGSRTEVEQFVGQSLWFPLSQLPSPDPDSFFYEDLKGLSIYDIAHQALGSLEGIQNFGAGDLLVVALNRETLSRLTPSATGKKRKPFSVYVRFTKKNIKTLSIEKGFLQLSEEGFNELKQML